MALNNPYAVYLDGEDDYGMVSYTPLLAPKRISVIIQANGRGKVLSKAYGGGYSLEITPSAQFRANIYIAGGYKTVTTTGATQNSRVFGVSYNGSTIQTYVDGIPDTGITQSGDISYSHNNVMAIGANPGSGSSPEPGQFTGTIDCISLWNRGLTDEEMALYSRIYLKGNESGLVALYRLDEGFGNIMYDSGPNGLHGAIYGASWVPGIVDLDWGYLDVATIMPINVGFNSMTLKGNLRGLGNYSQAECYFQYTDDPNFETGIVETLHQVKTTPGEFEQLVTGLDNTKTYYYRAVATGISL